MRKLGVAIVALAMLAVLALPRPAAAEDKGIIALQQSVALLMSQLADLQKSFNQQIGMMQGLVTQNTDTVNKLAGTLATIQHTLNGNTLVTSQNQTGISQQFQQLSDAVAALKAQMQQMDQTLQQVHQMQQTIPSSTAVAPGTNGNGTAADGSMPNGAANPASASGAAASSLQQYQQALNDFQSGAPQAQVELARFIRRNPAAPQVPDATYFLGTVFLNNGQFNEAIDQFNTLIEMYPDNGKTPLAELNKGVSLEKMGNRAAAISEFRALSKNHPGTQAARQADVELHRLERKR